MNLNGEQLQLKYIALAQVILWDENPKKHDVGGLMQSINVTALSIRRSLIRNATVAPACMATAARNA